MQQCSNAVLMVRPAAFGFNSETATTNSFQRPDEPGAATAAADVAALAVGEFDRLVSAVRGEGVDVCVAGDSLAPRKPDAVFPNNWLSLHPGGIVVLYPMRDPSRRAERRREIIDAATEELGYRVTRIIDLTHYESAGKFLEGTGSLVLDHVNRVAYACLSGRTDAQVLADWAAQLGYEPVLFTACDANGVPFYHTNVMMSIGERVAIVASDSIVPPDRDRVLRRLTASGRLVVHLGQREINGFAGNMLELATWDEALGDARVLVMSETARRALSPEQFAQLSGCTDAVLSVPIPTIERLGGGSVRCMMAEVFRGP